MNPVFKRMLITLTYFVLLSCARLAYSQSENTSSVTTRQRVTALEQARREQEELASHYVEALERIDQRVRTLEQAVEGERVRVNHRFQQVESNTSDLRSRLEALQRTPSTPTASKGTSGSLPSRPAARSVAVESTGPRMRALTPAEAAVLTPKVEYWEADTGMEVVRTTAILGYYVAIGKVYDQGDMGSLFLRSGSDRFSGSLHATVGGREVAALWQDVGPGEADLHLDRRAPLRLRLRTTEQIEPDTWAAQRAVAKRAAAQREASIASSRSGTR